MLEIRASIRLVGPSAKGMSPLLVAVEQRDSGVFKEDGAVVEVLGGEEFKVALQLCENGGDAFDERVAGEHGAFRIAGESACRAR